MVDNEAVVTETMMPVNGIEVCVETFGEPTDPPLLLIAGGASSMDWWDDEFCRRLAAGERFVIRYDHRDTGRSTSFPAGSPPYSGVDLAEDAVGVLDALDVPKAHLVGLSMGGGLAQRIAIERPDRVLSLTLMSSSPGPPAPDAPSHATTPAATEPSATAPTATEPSATAPTTTAPTTTATPGGAPSAAASIPATGAAAADVSAAGAHRPAADWSDRRTAVACLAEQVREHGGAFTADQTHLRRLVERVFDRTTDMAATQRNHWLIDWGPSLRDRLCSITVPTLVLHGSLDRFFPAEHPQALAHAIPGARLVWLEGVGHEYPPMAVWSTVIDEILGHARGRLPA